MLVVYYGISLDTHYTSIWYEWFNTTDRSQAVPSPETLKERLTD